MLEGDEEENVQERARARVLLRAMRDRGADRVGVTVCDLAGSLGWDCVATRACLLRQVQHGRVNRMGLTPSGTTLYTVTGAIASCPVL